MVAHQLSGLVALYEHVFETKKKEYYFEIIMEHMYHCVHVPTAMDMSKWKMPAS